jgi:hypothetical protein
MRIESSPTVQCPDYDYQTLNVSSRDERMSLATVEGGALQLLGGSGAIQQKYVHML